MQTQASSYRLHTIDFLRGIIMIIMALDHTRDFFHQQGLTGNPLDPASTTPWLYATRWVTHFCAPTFVFLSGLSAWLQGQRKTKGELGIFLIKRGLWLIVLDLTLMSFIFFFDIRFGFIALETLWAIGCGMFFLGLLIRLPFAALLTTGLVIFFGHNLLDIAEAQRAANIPVWWKLLHQPGLLPISKDHNILIMYPFLPWTGLTILGYCAGKLFTAYPPQKRKNILLGLGIAAIAFFFIARWINIYGDPRPWSAHDSALQTLYDFMNVQKYPPSLLFICATIGPVLVFLSLVNKATSRFAKIASVYGRTPLFYFVVHFFIIHTAQAITYLLRGHSFAEGITGIPGLPFKFAAPGEGYSLGIVYMIWIAVVILMYPLCLWFDGVKTRNRGKWWVGYV